VYAALDTTAREVASLHRLSLDYPLKGVETSLGEPFPAALRERRQKLVIKGDQPLFL
jgi:hypothetical protein